MSTPVALMTAPAAKMGRPTTDTEAMSLRVDRKLVRAIDAWRRDLEDLPTRPEAVRRLLRLALEAEQGREAEASNKRKR